MTETVGIFLLVLVNSLCIVALMYQAIEMKRTITGIATVQRDMIRDGGDDE